MQELKNEPEISVGLFDSADKLEFVLNGDYKLGNTSEIMNGTYFAQITKNGIILSNLSDRIIFKSELILIPEDIEKNRMLIKNVVIGIGFHWEQKKDFEYQGSLVLFPNIDGKTMTVINRLPVEKYLYSVISSEMSSLSSIELLKAHSIISRSFVLYQILNKETASTPAMISNENEVRKWYNREAHNVYDVCSDDHCQRYQGTTKIFTEAAGVAIRETYGLTLIFNGKICDAKYYKACGGFTEEFSAAWEDIDYGYLQAFHDNESLPENFEYPLDVEKNAEAWIKNAPTAYCNVNDEKILSKILPDFDQKTPDFYRWKISYTQEQLSEILKKKLKKDFGRIISIEPLQRGKSGRIVKMKITGDKKIFIIGKELEIRRALSESHLYSSAFVVEALDPDETGIPQKFDIIGAGWGHGVGLCQIGAAVMAEKGFSYIDILKHYYRNSLLRKMY